MSHNPNTVKSQTELNPCNDGKRSSDVLVEAISKLETTTKELDKIKKQLDIARSWLKDIADSVDIYFEKDGRSQEFTTDCLMGCGLSANQGLYEIKELDNVTG